METSTPRVIQFSTLGKNGRFGNQMYQYAFVRKYAELTKSNLETPKWIGESIFKNVPSNPIKTKGLKKVHTKKTYPSECCDLNTNLDFSGQYQCQCHLIYSREWVRNLYEYNSKTLKMLGNVELTDYVAVHVRRGDYVSLGSYCVVSQESYEELFRQLQISVKDVIWIYDDRDNMHSFKYPRYKCNRYDQLKNHEKMMLDFWYLQNSRILIRSNSTFSVWAGILHRGESVYSPDVGDLRGEHTVQFVKGNCCRCTPSYTDFKLL